MPRTTGPGRRAARALGDPRSVPSAAWVAAVTGAPRSEIEGYLREADELVDEERWIRATHRAGGRSMYAQFRAPFDVYAIVRATRPRTILETGVSSGVSSAHLQMALRANGEGRLISIDLPTRQRAARLARGESPVSLPPGRRTGWAVPPKWKRGWDLRLGPSQEFVPAVARDGAPIDLFLHDDLHTEEHLLFELRTLRPALGPEAVVLADNTAWTGAAFPIFAREVGRPMFRRRHSDLVGLRLGGAAGNR